MLKSALDMGEELTRRRRSSIGDAEQYSTFARKGSLGSIAYIESSD